MSVVLPPHSIDAERFVLGGLMNDPTMIPRVRAILRPEHFYIVHYQWIYSAICAAGLAADVTTVEALLPRFVPKSEDFIFNLGELTADLDDRGNAEQYARIVEQYAIRRQMITTASDMAKLAYDQAMPIDAVVERSQAMVLDVNSNRADTGMPHIREANTEFIVDLEQRMQHPGDPVGIPIGIHTKQQASEGHPGDLDKLMLGAEPGDFIVIAGRPGTGKSALMLQWARHAGVDLGLRVGFFSLEMSRMSLARRMASQALGIPLTCIRTGTVTPEQYSAILSYCDMVNQKHIRVKRVGSLTPAQMLGTMHRIISEEGLDIVFTDYLQLMQSDTRAENRTNEVAYISRKMKAMASTDDGGFGIPIVTGSQLNRAGVDKPDLDNLREGPIENDADKVLLLHRPDPEGQPNFVKAIIAKNRDGEGQGRPVPLHFNRDCVRFEPAVLQPIKL